MISANNVVKILHSFGRPEDYGGSARGSDYSFPVASLNEFAALSVHAMMLCHGFHAVVDETQTTTTKLLITEPDRLEYDLLPSDWIQRNDGNESSCFCFRYNRHPQSSMEYVVRVIPLGRKLQVVSTALDSPHVASMTIGIEDNFSGLALHDFPMDLRRQQLHLLFAHFKRLRQLFADFDCEIIQKISTPITHIVAYPHPTTSLRLTAPTTIQSEPMRGENPLAIGNRDVDPLGSIRPPTAGGGMIVGPDHPMFSQGGRFPGPPHPHPGPDRLPPGSVPPGARFDPISPFEDTRLRIPPSQRPPFRPPPHSGEPDFDELMPPGFNNNNFF